MGSFRTLITRAIRDGIQLPRNNMPGVAFPLLGEVKTVAVRVTDVDPDDASNHTRAEEEGMRQAELWFRFVRDYVPGFQGCRISETPATIGIRETNHLVGEYVLTAEDLLSGRGFEDTIGMGGYHLDIHTPDDPSSGELRQPLAYQMPFRALLPRGVDRLLVAGRAVSATHDAMASTRVIPIGMVQGQAAGTAAALAAARGCSPRDLAVNELQDALRAQGALLTPDDSPGERISIPTRARTGSSL